MFEKGRQFVKQWLDGLDRSLAADAARASQARHPGMTGGQREKAFSDALREFLPPSLHIGTGKVVSTTREPSRQTDVVIFDSRFPVFKQGDNALYPIEGVIATVEVKSSLNGERDLHDALDKCHSVMTLDPAFAKEDSDLLLDSLCASGMDREAAWERVVWTVVPRTYVFAFEGMNTIQSLAEPFRTWLSKGCGGTQSRPFIPSVIVTGGVVGVAWGDPVRVYPRDPAARPRDDEAVLISFEAHARFGILASHLLWHIERRTTLLDPAAGVRRAMSAYLPFEEYFDGVVKGGKYAITNWAGRVPIVTSATAPSTDL